MDSDPHAPGSVYIPFLDLTILPYSQIKLLTSREVRRIYLKYPDSGYLPLKDPLLLGQILKYKTLLAYCTELTEREIGEAWSGFILNYLKQSVEFLNRQHGSVGFGNLR